MKTKIITMMHTAEIIFAVKNDVSFASASVCNAWSVATTKTRIFGNLFNEALSETQDYTALNEIIYE